MLTKNSIIGILLLGLGILVIPAWAADYSTMSTEELAEMRGTNQDLPAEERAEFQKEWQKRVREMSRAEQQKYTGKPEDAPREGSGTGLGRSKQNNNIKDTGRNYGKMKRNGSGEGYAVDNQVNNSGVGESKERNRYRKNYRNQNMRFGSGRRSIGGARSGRGRR